jgi:hypothetical protein
MLCIGDTRRLALQPMAWLLQEGTAMSATAWCDLAKSVLAASDTQSIDASRPLSTRPPHRRCLCTNQGGLSD